MILLLMFLGWVQASELQDYPIEDFSKSGAIQALSNNLDDKFSVAGGTVTGETNITSGQFSVGGSTFQVRGGKASISGSTLTITNGGIILSTTSGSVGIQFQDGTIQRTGVVEDAIVKGWLHYNMATDAIADSYNISSITNIATGQDTINIDVDMKNANYAVAVVGDTTCDTQNVDTYATGSFRILCRDATAANWTNATNLSLIIIGDR